MQGLTIHVMKCIPFTLAPSERVWKEWSRCDGVFLSAETLGHELSRGLCHTRPLLWESDQDLQE